MTNLPQDLPSKIKIGARTIGEGERTFFIAEIGNNHNGDYHLAKRTIEEAAKAGADAVKFQKRFITETFAKELLNRTQANDEIKGKTYGEYRMELELNKDEFKKLKKVAEDLGMVFFATPFDHKSVDFLEDVDIPVYKIASFDVTNLPLLEYVAKKSKPIFLSVGMSSSEEIEEAVETILRLNNQLMILHCVAVYPAPDEKLNLSTIQSLKDKYKPLPIGYSGHEHDILPTLAAIALGANIIERHFTLDKLFPGPDHSTVSIVPSEFRELVDGARRIEKIKGSPRHEVFKEEQKTRDKHTKSVISKVKIPAGTVITRDMLVIKSPGYGFKPKMIDMVVGKKSKVDIDEDVVIKKEEIE